LKTNRWITDFYLLIIIVYLYTIYTYVYPVHIYIHTHTMYTLWSEVIYSNVAVYTNVNEMKMCQCTIIYNYNEQW